MNSDAATAATLTLVAYYGSEYSPRPGEPMAFEFRAYVETVEAAREIAASFPKACKFVGTTLSGRPGIRGVVSSRAALSSDGVNRGVNETGIRRYRAILAAAQRLGHAVEYSAPGGNCYPTREAFEAAIGVAQTPEARS